MLRAMWRELETGPLVTAPALDPTTSTAGMIFAAVAGSPHLRRATYESLRDPLALSHWKPAISTRRFFDLESLWDPKIYNRQHRAVFTFDPCFVPHVGSNS